MITVKVDNLTVHHHHDEQKLAEILTQLANVRKDIKEFRAAMKLTDQELKDLLDGIDKTTNDTANNVTIIGTAAQSIKTEMDTLLANANAGTPLTDAQVTQLQNIGARAQAISEAATTQATALTAIAAEGQPVTPPSPEPVVIPTPAQP